MAKNRKNGAKKGNGSNSVMREKGSGILEVVFILDRSGSMSGMEEDTIGGFNSMLKKQQKESDNVIWSTVLFDDRHEVIHNRVPIQRVRPLTEEEYYVRGCTALLDAVGRAIHHIAMCRRYAREGEIPEKTLFVITTDGMENSSVEYTYREVKRMIEREKEVYGWEFLFLGANIDAECVAGRMGISRERSARFHNDSRGIQENYAAFGMAMSRMADMEDLEEDCLAEVRADYYGRAEEAGR